MRCPKCHYLSFDPEPRCKNCGYDLDVEVENDDAGLALHVIDPDPEPAAPPDLPLRHAPPVARPVTLELVRPVPEPVRGSVREPEPELVGVGAAAPTPRKVAAPRSPHTTTELPLFVKAITTIESESLINEPVAPLVPVPVPAAPPAPAAPTPVTVPAPVSHLTPVTPDLETEPEIEIALPPASRPLSVRRPAEPAKAAPRVERRVGPIDHDLLDDLRRLDREAAERPAADLRRGQYAAAADETVSFSERVSAAALDGLLLGGIGAFVLWMTLKLCNAAPADLSGSAITAMAVFLAGVGIAYLLMFTAADGQTLGKMLMGIRVVGEGGHEQVTIGQAARRALLAPILIGPLGLGWLPTLFGGGLALHDRLSHTRVVRA